VTAPTRPSGRGSPSRAARIATYLPVRPPGSGQDRGGAERATEHRAATDPGDGASTCEVRLPRGPLAWHARRQRGAVGQAMQPVINLLRDHLLESGLIYSDETPCRCSRRSTAQAATPYAGIEPGTALMTAAYKRIPSRKFCVRQHRQSRLQMSLNDRSPSSPWIRCKSGVMAKLLGVTPRRSIRSCRADSVTSMSDSPRYGYRPD